MHAAPLSAITLATPAMGTRFELVLSTHDSGLMTQDFARLRAAGESALEEIRHWHDRLSWFDQGSFISHINTHAASRPVECDPEFFELLLLCRDVWSASGGAFDPTIAALMRASGFRGDGAQQSQLTEALAATGFDKIHLDEPRRTIRYTQPNIGLDLGAVGKGFAIDRAIRLLRDSGVTSALLHGGTSSIAAIGSPRDMTKASVAQASRLCSNTGWLIRIGPDPTDPVIPLRDASLGVSAPSGRVVRTDSGSRGHILDPRTGLSVASAHLAAVIADSCAAADAWSTALLVEGRRPVGMPPAFTSLVKPAGTNPEPWRIDGPHAATLILHDNPPNP